MILFGLSLMLLIPGIMWAVYYTFIMQAVVLKRLSGTKAVAYSKSLVQGRSWQEFGAMLIVYILIGAIMGGIQL